MKWKLLDGLADTEVQALLSIARRRKFARGEVVFHQHDPADTLHLVDKGRFAVRVATPLGDTAILSQGPAAGVAVATVGTAELSGAEKNIGSLGE